MSEVVLTRRARKDLDQLDHATRRRILDKLSEYTDDPLRHAVKLADVRIGSYRFRVGDWRIVFDLNDDRVVVLRIGHRREIYRR